MFFRRDAIIPMSGSAFSKGGKNMAKKDGKYSKLVMNDRMLIQSCIAKGESAASIAGRIGFSASTVYRESARAHRNAALSTPGPIAPTTKPNARGTMNSCDASSPKGNRSTD